MRPRSLPKNVFVVDNDRERNLKLATLIKRFGYNVFVATESHHFTRIVEGMLPHLVMLNLNMPPVEGKSCLEWIRGKGGLSLIKIISMADKGDTDKIEESLTKGANAGIVRPASPTDIFKVMEDNLEATSRQVPRLNVIFKAKVVAESGKIDSFVTNMSEGGVFIRTMKPFPVNTKVKVSLDLPSAKPVVVDGEVSNQIRYSSEKFNEPGMGIRFVNMIEGMRPALKRFVEEQLAGDLDKDCKV